MSNARKGTAHEQIDNEKERIINPENGRLQIVGFDLWFISGQEAAAHQGATIEKRGSQTGAYVFADN
jgi:hypothetical protein